MISEASAFQVGAAGGASKAASAAAEDLNADKRYLSGVGSSKAVPLAS